jgi:predicted exporter
VALVAVATLLGLGWSRLGVNDDIRTLQNPPKHLINEQIKLGKLLDAPTPVQFYLVRGATAEAVLQREEALKRRLDPLIAQHTISGYQAISNWVPSAQTQVRRTSLMKEKLLADDGALPLLANRIGEDAVWVRTVRERAADAPLLTVEAFMQSPASEPWRHLWLGKLGGAYASVVAVRGLGVAKLPELQQAAAGLEGVQWVDKVADISSVLGRYRQYMGWALLFSYGAVFFLLFLRYRAATWRVLAPTALASCITLALLGLAGHQLQLFHVLALMLLLGIGVDYGVFFQERPDRRDAAAWMAVSLSAASTLLSFGLLGLSKTPALQAFGLTMLLGTALVWLIVPCFARERAQVTPVQQMEEVCK